MRVCGGAAGARRGPGRTAGPRRRPLLPLLISGQVFRPPKRAAVIDAALSNKLLTQTINAKNEAAAAARAAGGGGRLQVVTVPKGAVDDGKARKAGAPKAAEA